MYQAPYSEQQNWHGTETTHTQFFKTCQCILLWVFGVIVNENLLSDFKFVLLEAIPSRESHSVHGEDVPVVVMICWFVNSNDPLSLLFTAGYTSVNFPFLYQKDGADCPQKNNE